MYSTIKSKNLEKKISPSLNKNSYSVQSEFIPLGLTLSPHGNLSLDEASEELISQTLSYKIRAFFELGLSIGLLRLGITKFEGSLPASFAFWQRFSELFISNLCKQSHLEISHALSTLEFPLEEILPLIKQVPFMSGIKYLTPANLNQLWQGLIQALKEELLTFDGNLQDYLAAHHSPWHTVGKLCFHLAENKTNTERPFAFLATYSQGLSKSQETQYLPLGRALEEYAGKKSLLLALLLPLQRATEHSQFLKALMDSGKIFQPLAWGAVDAHQFLQDIPHFEAAGLRVQVPNWWTAKQPPRPQIKISIGNETPTALGLGALLDFDLRFALPNGEQLSAEEFQSLLSEQAPLVQIKGQWVQIDSHQLKQVLTHWKTVEKQVHTQGLSFAEGLRLLAGVSNKQHETLSQAAIASWSHLREGNYLQQVLNHLRRLETDEKILATLAQCLEAELRPYQILGVQWLWWLYNMRLGGCLADDMGLGKTIQVLSLLLLIKHQNKNQSKSSPHLLIDITQLPAG